MGKTLHFCDVSELCPLFTRSRPNRGRLVTSVSASALSFDHLVGGDRKSLRPTVHWPTLIMLTTVVISSKALL
jgi:hypothetical protein